MSIARRIRRGGRLPRSIQPDPPQRTPQQPARPLQIVIRPEAVEEVDRWGALALTAIGISRVVLTRAGELLGVSYDEAGERLTTCLTTGKPVPAEFERAASELGGYSGPNADEAYSAIGELLDMTDADAGDLVMMYALDQGTVAPSMGLVAWVMARSRSAAEPIGVSPV